MAVCVDQSGHQGLARDIDNVPVNRSTRRSVHCHDAVALDDDDGLIEVLGLHAVENLCVQERRSIHEYLRSLFEKWILFCIAPGVSPNDICIESMSFSVRSAHDAKPICEAPRSRGQFVDGPV